MLIELQYMAAELSPEKVLRGSFFSVIECPSELSFSLAFSWCFAEIKNTERSDEMTSLIGPESVATQYSMSVLPSWSRLDRVNRKPSCGVSLMPEVYVLLNTVEKKGKSV